MKKLLVMVLCAMLCACLLNGCAKPTPEPTADTTTQGQGTPADTAPQGIAWPEKSIEIIIPYSAGGDSDTFLRAAANALSKELNVNVVVSNVTGGGTQGALASVLNADADGYTILYYNSTHLNQEASGSMGDMSLVHDYMAGGSIAKDATYCIMVRADSGWKTMDEMLAYAKAHPDFKFASGSKNTFSYLLGKIEDSPKVDFTIPTVLGDGSASGRTLQLLSGEVDAIIANYGNFLDYIANGELVCLGIMSPERNEKFPDVPTLKEQGYDCTIEKYYSFRFKNGTDERIIAKFNEALQKAIQDADFVKIVDSYGSTPCYVSPADQQPWEEAELALTKKYFDMEK